MKTFEEENEPLVTLFSRAAEQGPEGYTLLAFRRARNSTRAWEAEYEKTEIFMMRCG